MRSFVVSDEVNLDYGSSAAMDGRDLAHREEEDEI